jgi:GTP pyrophosphokinase
MTDDLRVIFIKLVDRLHNLQTLKFLPEAGQRRIAAETLEIYAPIANRLGMGRIKAELEDLAFRYVNPEEYFRVAALVEPKRKPAEGELKKLRKTLDGLMKDNHIPAEIVHRLKRLYSIHRKMEAQHIEFHQVYDFLALRIITDTVKNCYAALGIIHQRWTHIPHRFRDFIAMPKPNLYQALHTTIITEDKLSVEIQIRTREMHDLAENGIAAHWRYKDGEALGPIKEDKRLLWLREMAELYNEHKNPKEFVQNLKINLIPGRGLGPRFRLPHPFRNRAARRRSPHQRTPGAAQDAPADRRHRRDPDRARAGACAELAEHGLHLGRPAPDQALAGPAGQDTERRAGPQALGKGARQV